MPQCDDGDLAGHPTPGPTPVGGITLGTWHPEFQACRSLQLAQARWHSSSKSPQLAACAWRKLGHELGVKSRNCAFFVPGTLLQVLGNGSFSNDRDLFCHGAGALYRGSWKSPSIHAARSYAPSDHSQSQRASADKSGLLQLRQCLPVIIGHFRMPSFHVSGSEYRYHTFPRSSARQLPSALPRPNLIYTHPGSQSAPSCPGAECLHSSLPPSTETTPSLPTVTSVFASAPHFTATPGALVRRGSDHALDVLRYCCTVTPVAPTVARNCPV